MKLRLIGVIGLAALLAGCGQEAKIDEAAAAGAGEMAAPVGIA